MNIRHELEARLNPPPHIRLSDVDLDPAAIRAVMINEVVPADPAQDFYGSSGEEYLSTALPLFRQAGHHRRQPAHRKEQGRHDRPGRRGHVRYHPAMKWVAWL